VIILVYRITPVVSIPNYHQQLITQHERGIGGISNAADEQETGLCA
jgi:hypothetical protein